MDATRLASGSITGNHQYDAIIFNAPKADTGWKGTPGLIDAVLSSALDVLKPGGQMRFSGTSYMPGTPHLVELLRNRPPGYGYAYSSSFLSDEYGVPYNVFDSAGNRINVHWSLTTMSWYVFVK